MKISSIWGLLVACMLGLYVEASTVVPDVSSVPDLPSSVDMTLNGAESSTTTVPSTTTRVATTPPATETPSEETDGKWFVRQNNITCLRMDMSLQFVVEYTKNDDTKANVTLELPGTQDMTEATGDCGFQTFEDEDRHNYISIPWHGYEGWTVDFYFILPHNDKEYHCNTVVFNFVIDDHFEDAKEYETPVTSRYDNATLYQVEKGNSWQCNSEVSVSHFEDDLSAVKLMHTKDLTVEAFGEKDDLQHGFSESIPCPEDTEVSTIVPIAVGAALAALVVIVLIAYMIGRRRNKRGYESV